MDGVPAWAADDELDLSVDDEGVVTLDGQPDKTILVVLDIATLERLLTLVSEYYITANGNEEQPELE